MHTSICKINYFIAYYLEYVFTYSCQYVANFMSVKPNYNFSRNVTSSAKFGQQIGLNQSANKVSVC